MKHFIVFSCQITNGQKIFSEMPHHTLSTEAKISYKGGGGKPTKDIFENGL